MATAAAEKKARDLLILDVRGRASYTDWFVICSGATARQTRAIADAVVEALQTDAGEPLGVEGLTSARRVLIDGGDVVVHVFEDSQRGYYDLEGLWIDAPRTTPADLGIEVDARPDEGPKPPVTVPPIPT